MDKTEKRVIALGFFDGVHVGHGMLLKRTAELAASLHARACALTFDTHPEKLITGHGIPLINTSGDRAGIMKSLYGIEEVIFAHFDEALMRMPWDAFIRDMLLARFHAVHVVAGHDFYFGYKGQGNPKKLLSECARLGIGCDVIGCVEIDGIVVSSTYIRKLIAQGDMERASVFLGHPHILSGRVRRGRRLGTRIGIPTINLTVPNELQEPARGVYATRTDIDGKKYRSVTNIGIKPTIEENGSEVLAETTILDYSGDLYGRTVTIEFYRHLRPELKFPSIEALREQIHLDIAQTRAYFDEKTEKSPI